MAHTQRREAHNLKHMYRVDVDWLGGGLGFTRPFSSAEDAQAWGEQKAGSRPADVTVTARPDHLAEVDASAVDFLSAGAGGQAGTQTDAATLPEMQLQAWRKRGVL